MPTYEYECKTCGHTFDVFQNMSDEPVKVCPQCGGEVRRLINGGTGVIFKGSGFYVTDKKKSSGGTPSKVKKDDKTPGAEASAGTGAGKAASSADAGKSAEAAAPKPKAETGKT
ncbi:MAG: zinc ribbon domain-containing protein [Treponema sp.]|jgi:putative FmdB family regulatory protein|nr:zinc ribbon domain-containing protein [Treponema sp.]